MEFIKRVENYLFNRFHKRLNDVEKGQTRATVLQCQVIAENHRQKKQIHSLAEVEFSCYSQWGEDGIIDWLIEMLPEIPNTFIEFGVQDYRESNTRVLLHLRNWQGLVIDGSEGNISDIKRQDVSWKYDLMASCAFIDCENINQLITTAGMSGSVGLLSVDIDGNDYWVWQSISAVSPAIVVCEYNALFGDQHQISVPYKSDFVRTKAHYSNLYFGASLPALVTLAEEKGYTFVGTNTNGCNAFFVREDLKSYILDAVNDVKGFPSSFSETRSENGKLSYVRGCDRLDIIKHMPVYNFKTNSICSLEDLGNLYSPDWS